MALPRWSLLALAAATCIAGHYLTLRAAAGRIGDALGALLLEGSAALGILLLLLLRVGDDNVPSSARGVLFSCASGLCISGATTLLFATLRHGGPVASTGTLVLGGGVAFAALCAPFVFDEALTTRRLFGIALGLGSMVVLATERHAP